MMVEVLRMQIGYFRSGLGVERPGSERDEIVMHVRQKGVIAS